MTSQGRQTQKGINAQNWAAMSLFLQYVTRADFNYIGFEGEKLEDFHLVFNDGRKVICESKAGTINLADIRKILDNVIKHNQISDQDEILIVCKKVNRNAKGLIENLKYFRGEVKKKLMSKQHKFREKHLKLLPQLRFWEVSQDVNRKAVEVLMAKVFNYPEPFWVPKRRLKQLSKSLVEDKVYFGSQKGEELSRVDFLNLLEREKIEILNDDGFNYEEIKQVKEEEVKKIIKSIKTKSRTLSIPNELVKLHANPSIHHFALTKLENEKNLNLSDWNSLWESTYQSAFSIELFKIFSNSIESKKNQEYAINFILDNIEESTNYFREEFIKYDIVKLCESILELNPSLEQKIFKVIREVYKHSIERFLYVKRRRDDSWEREKTAELLEKVYDKTKSNSLKINIIGYIIDNFNLIADDGKFWHYTPPSVFRIVGKHVAKDPEKLVPWFTSKCVEQYIKFYRRFGRKLRFGGWELMGGGISQSGKEFSISDRHFVTQILSPALSSFYKSEKTKTWKFVLLKCITRNQKKVSMNKPDFLNRAAIPVLIEEYKNGNNSNEAFDILSDFVRMRQGIPWKNDLIFQAMNNDHFTDEKKWRLIKVSLEEFNNLPSNVFVEQITSDLAEKSKNKTVQQEATEVIESWVENPEYDRYHGTGSFDVIDNVSKLLDNKKTFKKGIEILRKYLSSQNFIKKTSTFDTYDVARTVAIVIEKSPVIGIDLLKDLNSSKKLSINQQIIISGGLYNISDDKKEILLEVYKGFLKTTLSVIGDIKQIEKRFNHRHSRQSFVQFAEKLAKAQYFEESLWLVKVFINDSDPILENYPDDPSGEFNYHKKVIEGDDNPTISTVRGYCAWTLQKFCTRYGRSHIPKILDLVEKLAEDPNYYVRVQACIPLLELVKNRHTVLSEKSKERFLTIDIAERIESIAFRMLRNKENQKLSAVMKHLAMVFAHMRTLDEKRAIEVLEIFRRSKFESVISEISPLYIFFAEFRDKSFKDWPWGNISKFDSKPFKMLLTDLLKNGTSEMKSALSWQLQKLPDEIKRSAKAKGQMTVENAASLSSFYLTLATTKYDQQAFKNIYRFIEDYIDSYFEECFDLWKECIKTESKYFKDNWIDERLHEMYWLPFFYNGKVLVTILKERKEEEFLAWFKKLAKYPEKVYIANDLDLAVEELVGIQKKKYKKKIEDLFKRLISRDPKYYEFKKRWESLRDKK